MKRKFFSILHFDFWTIFWELIRKNSEEFEGFNSKGKNLNQKAIFLLMIRHGGDLEMNTENVWKI